MGANLEEAKAASTKREFIRCAEISLREARESVYWLRICGALSLVKRDEFEELVGEGEQLRKILSSIVLTAKQRQREEALRAAERQT